MGLDVVVEPLGPRARGEEGGYNYCCRNSVSAGGSVDYLTLPSRSVYLDSGM